MDKTKMKMTKLYFTICLGLLVKGVGCSQLKDSSRSAVSFYSKNKTETFSSFKNWEIYKRRENGDTITVMDYTASDGLLLRALMKFENSHWVKVIAPQKDSSFTLLRDYSTTRLSNMGIRKNQLELNVELYYKLRVKKILYRKEFDGVIISNGDFTMIKLLSDKLKSKVPENYKILDKNWYYYSGS